MWCHPVWKSSWKWLTVQTQADHETVWSLDNHCWHHPLSLAIHLSFCPSLYYVRVGNQLVSFSMFEMASVYCMEKHPWDTRHLLHAHYSCHLKCLRRMGEALKLVLWVKVELTWVWYCCRLRKLIFERTTSLVVCLLCTQHVRLLQT